MEHAPSSDLASPEQYIQPWIYSMFFHLSLFLPELWRLLYCFIKRISYWVTEIKQAKNEKKSRKLLPLKRCRGIFKVTLNIQEVTCERKGCKSLCVPWVRWNNVQYVTVLRCFSVHYYNLKNRNKNYKFILTYSALAKLFLKMEFFGVTQFA